LVLKPTAVKKQTFFILFGTVLSEQKIEAKIKVLFYLLNFFIAIFSPIRAALKVLFVLLVKKFDPYFQKFLLPPPFFLAF
jgi:hypothetical protein